MGSSMDAGGDAAAGSSGAPRGSRAGGAGQVVQVGASGFVELEGAREGVEDFVGGSGEVATFEAGVVVDADACEQGDLPHGGARAHAGCCRRRAVRPAAG